MRITEFQAIHYGPLKPTGQIKLKDFDLFYGKNEFGKTLLIDSVVKLLLGGNSQSFYAIDRVDEFPEGYALITDESGKTLKLPEKGDLTQLTDLTATEFRNVFIIRNSDLTIPAGEEFEFYKNVTERLTGLRTPQIRLIKDELQKIGNLTKPDSNATLTDGAYSGKLKSRVKRAGNLIQEIDDLLEEARTEKLDELEEEISKVKETEKTTALEIENLEVAQKREKYEEGMKTYESLVKTIEQLQQLEIFNEDDEQSWKDAERDKKEYEKQRKSLSTKLKETREEFEKKNSSLEEMEREFAVFDGRKKIIDEAIRPKLKSYEAKSEEAAALQSKERFATASSSVFLVLLAISLIGLAISNLLLFTFSAVLFLILVLLFSAFKLQSLRKRGSVAALWQEIRLDASKYELEASNVEQILAKVQTFDENYFKDQEALQVLRTKVGVLKSNVLRISDEDLPSIEQALREIENTISRLKSKSKVEDLKNYVRTLKMKKGQEKVRDGSIGILNSHFGQKSKKATIMENLDYWNEKIAELEPYKDKSKDLQYSEKKVSQLNEIQQDTEKRKEELEEKIAEFHGKLENIGIEANGILKPTEPLLCETLVDLQGIQETLRKFADDINSNMDTVLEVMKLFEEMEGEEEQKVEQLFGEDSPVSNYFSEITDGLYQKVEYISGEQKIRATMKTGDSLDADKLSGGAYDQLYLSIRLALGEKLLKGSKGFLILDDPFIKADIDRLGTQLDILKRISKQGWQILYFTAKDEVKTALKEDLTDKKIGYHEVQNLFS